MKKIEDEYELKIIKSEKTHLLGVEVGVEATHTETGLTASSTRYSSQYRNKVAAIALLRRKLTSINAWFTYSEIIRVKNGKIREH